MPPDADGARQTVSDAWLRAWGEQPPPGRTALGVCFAVAVALVLWRPGWSRLRYLSTLCHEGGHALVAGLCGRRLSGVRLERRSGGVTRSWGRSSGPGFVATLLAGYPAPGLVGLALLALAVGGRPGLALLLALVGTVSLAVWMRSVLGWVVALLTTAALALLLVRPGLAAPAAPGLGAFLLVAGTRDALDLWSARRRVHGSDADQLAAATGVPAPLWVLLLALVAAGSLAGGLWLAFG